MSDMTAEQIIAKKIAEHAKWIRESADRAEQRIRDERLLAVEYDRIAMRLRDGGLNEEQTRAAFEEGFPSNSVFFGTAREPDADKIERLRKLFA